MWQTVKLGDIAELYQPKTITKSEMTEDGAYPVYGANGIIGRYDDFNHDGEQLVIGCRGSCGEVNITSGKCWITGNAMVVKPNANVLLNFLKYFLLQREVTNAVITGTAQPQITRKSLAPIQLYLPPIAEQKRIVTKLDAAFAEIDRAIEMSRTAKSSARNLVNATVQNALSNAKFGWQIHKLEDISENLDSKRIPVTKSLRLAGNTPYYGASGIVDYIDGYIFDEDLLLISEDGANLLMRTYPIAFPVSGKTWVNNHAHVLRFSDSETQKWVELYLNTIDLSEFISGMAQPKLNQKKLNEIPIPLPSKLTFTDVLNLVNTSKMTGEKLSAVYMAKEVLWENLKSALLVQELQPSEAA
jgi:type I restriction enzyme, S subunit